MTYMHKHYVFGLNVSVENLMPVHETDSVEEVADDEGGTFLGQGLAGGDDVVELSVGAEFEDGVEVVLVAEEAEGLDDVGVVEEGLDLEFPDELHQQVVLQDLLLVHHLQRHDHPRVDLPA